MVRERRKRGCDHQQILLKNSQEVAVVRERQERGCGARPAGRLHPRVQKKWQGREYKAKNQQPEVTNHSFTSGCLLVYYLSRRKLPDFNE